MNYIINNIIIPINKDQNSELKKELKKRKINTDNLNSITYLKRSIDSRSKKSIKFVYNISIDYNGDLNLSKLPEEPILKNKGNLNYKNIVIIGAGPSGLFAALRSAEIGLNPIIFEKGEDVDNREQSVKRFLKNGELNVNSNIQFGEGGAGTYSDGKLTTRVRSIYIDKVFKELVAAGANPEIMYDYKPHIGTDILKKVVKNLREKIIQLGGRFHFNSKLENIYINNGKIEGIKVNDEKIETNHLILATGHSSREVYKILYNVDVALESKGFAVGFRIEHPRSLIDRMQYGKQIEKLGAAPYNFTYNNKKSKKGVYTFCMCPGGEIVNGASEYETSLTNGMSNSARNSRFSNSAVLVSIGKDDFGDSLFDGVQFQEKIEKKVYSILGDYGSLYQNLFDFIKNSSKVTNIETNYKMNLMHYNLNNIFSESITLELKNAFNYWKNNRYFISEEANLFAAETRTSSPIRIVRKSNGESVNTKNLFVIGEGAGYAGGIVSSAVDGVKLVEMNF